MASTEELHQVVGKLLLDPSFRSEFAVDPTAAAAKVKVHLTPDEDKSFREFMSSFIAAAAELEKGAAATATGKGVSPLGHILAIFRQ